ncbi:FadR/GntR family transcriptional regulator [Ramlibacter sp.]|uniref:FadR/GntR family transcriptional regulator n=1 Tax=Ramlibacter sp. TaxID=1917967 RepID=UPI003D0D6B72
MKSSARSTGAPVAANPLADLLTSATYPLHSRLPPERELAETLNLPRGKVRQALKQLEDEGRIWRRVGMGTFVGGRPRSIQSRPESLGGATTLNELFEMRSLVEPIVAGLAALRAEEADIAMMRQYSARADTSTNWADWERWDELLHRAIVEASGNGLLINTIDQLLRIKAHPRWTIKRASAFDPALTARYGREHAAVIHCIAERDSEGAKAAMHQHMLGVSTTVGPAISNRSQRSS